MLDSLISIGDIHFSFFCRAIRSFYSSDSFEAGLIIVTNPYATVLSFIIKCTFLHLLGQIYQNLA
jgi:hypothetical protein